MVRTSTIFRFKMFALQIICARKIKFNLHIFHNTTTTEKNIFRGLGNLWSGVSVCVYCHDATCCCCRFVSACVKKCLLKCRVQKCRLLKSSSRIPIPVTFTVDFATTPFTTSNVNLSLNIFPSMPKTESRQTSNALNNFISFMIYEPIRA